MFFFFSVLFLLIYLFILLIIFYAKEPLSKGLNSFLWSGGWWDSMGSSWKISYHISYHIISYQMIIVIIIVWLVRLAPVDSGESGLAIRRLHSLLKVTITPTSVGKNQFFMLFYIFIYLLLLLLLLLLFIYLVFFLGGGGGHFILHIMMVSFAWTLFHTSHALYSCSTHSLGSRLGLNPSIPMIGVNHQKNPKMFTFLKLKSREKRIGTWNLEPFLLACFLSVKLTLLWPKPE